MQSAIWTMPLHLRSLAYEASLDVFFDGLLHAWPPPASRQQFKRLLNAKMATQWIIMNHF
jgi:hypothetical protein